MIECITKVSSIRVGEMLFVCSWEMVPTMGKKKNLPLTHNSLHGKGYMQYLGWLRCKVVQREYIDTSYMYFTKRVYFNWKSSIV